MDQKRRGLLGSLAAVLVAGLLQPIKALAAWNKEAFAAKTPGDALKGLGASSTEPTKAIVIEAPQIAENGAVRDHEQHPGHDVDRRGNREEPVPARRAVRLQGRRPALREAEREDGRDFRRARSGERRRQALRGDAGNQGNHWRVRRLKWRDR